MNKQSVIPRATLHEPLPHDSAPKHVSGRAEYIDDIVEPAGTLHAYLALSERAHAEIASIDLDEVRRALGAIGVLTHPDIPGEPDVSSGPKHDEPVFPVDRVQFWGQPLFAVIGETRDQARRASRLARVEYRDLPHRTDVDAARSAGGRLVIEPLKLERGDVEAGLASAPGASKAPCSLAGGPLLSRRPDRPRHSGRGRRRHGLVVHQHPLKRSDGCPGARHRHARGHRQRAPHGRRLRRQGDAGQPVRGGRRARSQEVRACGQDQA